MLRSTFIGYAAGSISSLQNTQRSLATQYDMSLTQNALRLQLRVYHGYCKRTI